jgi:hypothetical protein
MAGSLEKKEELGKTGLLVPPIIYHTKPNLR